MWSLRQEANLSGFDEFWEKVPNKIGKGAARRAWANARKTTSAETIISGVPKFVSYERARASQPDYRPLHPSTWLNGERWADEGVTERRKGATPTTIADIRKKEPEPDLSDADRAEIAAQLKAWRPSA